MSTEPSRQAGDRSFDAGAGGPLISVVIPTFNAERTIDRALRSVLSQTWEKFEIIVADDCSSDATAAIVTAYDDPRITFVPSDAPTNTGPAPTRNRGIALARGPYLAFLDADDEWSPDKLSVQLRYLQENADCSIVVTNAEDVAPDGTLIDTEFGGSPPTAGADAWRHLLKRSFIETSSVMTRTALVRELGGFDPKLFVSQDQDLWIRLALHGKVGIIDAVHGRIHTVPTGHMTRNVMRQVDIMLPMIERHVAQAGNRLTDAERADILGYRYERVGRSLFLTGASATGARLLFKAARWNGRWFGNLAFMCHANRPARWLKARLNRIF